MDKYVIGVDYGTDSVRSIIVNARNGEEIAGDVHYYTRWKEGKYCDPSGNQFRQHPLDYLEGLENTIRNALAKAPARSCSKCCSNICRYYRINACSSEYERNSIVINAWF